MLRFSTFIRFYTIRDQIDRVWKSLKDRLDFFRGVIHLLQREEVLILGKLFLIHLLSEDFRDLFVVLIYKLLKGSALHLHNVCCTREWDRDLL